MARSIDIPGDELREVQRMLNLIHDRLDFNSRSINFDATFGQGLKSEAKHFEDRWNDGKKLVKKEILDLRTVIGQVMDAFEQTDQDVSANLPS